LDLPDVVAELTALHQADTALTLRISARIPPAAAARMLALIAEASDDPGGDGDGREAFAFIKSDPGGVSLKTCEEEAAKLALLRHIGLPGGLFADVAPKVLAAWRARAAMEAPSHLREHQDPVKLTLLAALLYCRQREITDTLADLLITTVHRINARAEIRVVKGRGGPGGGPGLDRRGAAPEGRREAAAVLRRHARRGERSLT
jgi:hypothetical protein